MTKDVRPGERFLGAQRPADDAGLRFLGWIHTPWTTRQDCPRNARVDLSPCRIELEPVYAEALIGIDTCTHLIVLYWLDEARRDLAVQAPGFADRTVGTLALRSPNRPNPIGLAVAKLLAVEGTTLTVSGLDCRDGTPLLDLKPYFPRTDAVDEAEVGWFKPEWTTP